jgi:hypothetical protein
MPRPSERQPKDKEEFNPLISEKKDGFQPLRAMRAIKGKKPDPVFG